MSIRNHIKIKKKYIRHPINWRCTHPVDKDGKYGLKDDCLQNGHSGMVKRVLY